MAKLTTEEFIKKAKAVHGDRYEYSKVAYVNIFTKVCIICPEHGEFMQVARQHLIGRGCSICSGYKKWNYQTCYESAKQFKTRNDFKKNEVGAYTKALKNGWLKDYIWFETQATGKTNWTREKCFEEAKKYHTKAEMNKGNHSAYNIAKAKGWFIDYTWFVNGHTLEGGKRKKWTYETCYEEAKKYTNRTDFQYGKGSSRAYKVARDNGWLDDYSWFSKGSKPAGYWTYERCREEAMKYNYMSDYRHGNHSAYVISRRNDWLKEYDWLIKKKQYWTYQECFDLAKRYTTKTEFKQACSSAYRAAYEHEWLNDYTWFVKKVKTRYWTKERCYEEAKKYLTKSDFSKNCSAAYTIACKNGWIVDYNWLVDRRMEIYNEQIDSVYYYYFQETNTIYIGRTINKKARDYQHIFETDRDSVAKYAKELNCKVPPMIILEDGLTIKEGQEKEHYWKKFYSDMGFNILNRGVTGVGRGSIGAIGFGKWSKEKCYEEAKKYTSKSSFKLANGSAYSAAKKRGWIKEYTWLKELKTPESYWTYEKCYEEAKKCNSLKEFYKGHERAYRVAKKKGWIKDYSWFIKPTPIIKWTYEACLEKARTCHSKIEFETKYPGAMNVARRNNWLKDYTWFKRPAVNNSKWTFKRCQEEASKYSSRSEFARNSKSAYLKAKDNDWLDDFFPSNE